ncbi:MAG TPA: HipA domain-containing protein [Polyangiaceae bacterium]|nr:HipA domain-containing protein [Polyangiaceae bacterium]
MVRAMTREDHFRVYLYDRAIGHLHRREDCTRFVFDADYLNDPHRAVLGLRFEENLSARHVTNMRLPPWFSNLLPEGRLREWIRRTRGQSVDREMELLAQVGHDLPGAVRVLAADAPVVVDVTEDPHPPARADEVTPVLWRFSLAGVGLKFSMLAQGDRFTAPAAGEGGDWIVKLPDPEHPHVPLNELAMMTLAGAAGIEVPDVKLVHRDLVEPLPDQAWPHGEALAYAIRRFDRGKSRELIHIEDMAQVRGFYPDDKYAGSFETIGALVYRHRDVEALREFARRLAFNILIGNGDAHLKNWSLIYRNRRTPTLAPAYDLVATAIYRPANLGPENLGLKLGGSRRFEVATLNAFDALDKKLGAKADLASVVVSLVENVVAEWPRAAEILKSNDKMAKEIERWVMNRVQALR